MYRRLRTLPAETLLKGEKHMDLTEIMQEAQQAIGGDYEQCAISNVQCAIVLSGLETVNYCVNI